MKSSLGGILLFFISLSAYAQSSKDTVGIMPVIKTYKWGNVFPVAGNTFKPDPTLQYKILIDLLVGPKNNKDTANFTDINWGLGEIGRRINLHVADGIPLKNIDMVVAVHGFALSAMLKDEVYKKKYGISNPNLILLDELKKAGVKIIVCGQSMHLRNVAKEDLIAGTMFGLTAQTVLTSYQAKGYSLFQIKNED